MNKLQTIICSTSVIALLAGGLIFLSANNSQKADENKPLVQTFTTVPEFGPTVQIAGEKIDLTRYDMFERYDRELTSFTYTHNATLLIMKRANRFFPIMEPILKEEGVPTDFLYLCAIESTLNTRAISPAKAAGLWQFMEGTGKQFGLEDNGFVDKRYNIEEASRAACE